MELYLRSAERRHTACTSTCHMRLAGMSEKAGKAKSAAAATRSANSREKKYRRGARAWPTCGAATITRSKFPKDNPKWWCDKRNGGCGSEFDGDDTRILEQSPTIDPMIAADQ